MYESAVEELSERHQECFEYMLLGYGYKSIGAMMGIAIGTVGNHASKILHKIDAPDRITMILKYYGLPNWTEGR